jgi:hypothetical protein
MGKFYVTGQNDDVDEVVMLDDDGDEFSLYDDGSTLDIRKGGDYKCCFYKSDIDKMIALFQAAKDKLCN